MTYLFVPAYYQLGRRKGPVKAFVVHMAEGGGTVSYLAKPNPNRVSVHYVVERGGRVVQMLEEADASGSINPRDIRTTDGPPPYGATTAKAVMGEWWKNPNAAVISCEVEGFAASGPSAIQHAALKNLVDDVRSRFPDMGMLGHRDFADYKACPGRFIHWSALGGHGAPSEDTDVAIRSKVIDPTQGIVTIDGEGHALITFEGRHVAVPAGQKRDVLAKVELLEPLDDNPGDRKTAYLVGAIPGKPNSELAYLLAVDGKFAGRTKRVVALTVDGAVSPSPVEV